MQRQRSEGLTPMSEFAISAELAARASCAEFDDTYCPNLYAMPNSKRCCITGN
jgi:hypothetical protein